MPPGPLNHLSSSEDADGSVTLTHAASGSYIRFHTNGDLDIHATGSAKVTSEKYLFLQDASTTESVDEEYLAAVVAGDERTVQLLVKDGAIPHLKERATQLARLHGWID